MKCTQADSSLEAWVEAGAQLQIENQLPMGGGQFVAEKGHWAYQAGHKTGSFSMSERSVKCPVLRGQALIALYCSSVSRRRRVNDIKEYIFLDTLHKI